jgi:ABC-2 type transport system ATP-binding protein
MTTEIVYDIQNLVKLYPRQPMPANRCLNLQIYRGEIFGLLGDNGAGKTTLVRQMVNLQASTSGKILLFGEVVGRYPQLVPRFVGYMPQDSAALNQLSVAEALYWLSATPARPHMPLRRCARCCSVP